jgi:predicted ATPase/class 3 adenylate cyclase
MPTFLFTDIEGSTRQWESDPDSMTVALAGHDSVLTAAVESTGGRVVKSTGDGMLAVFTTTRQAVDAAIDAQRSLRTSEGPLGPMRVRMGIHAGEVETRDGDYFGQVMNRAARVMASGHGGQILLSGAAADDLDGALPELATLRDLGVHRLKDLTLPERLYQVVHRDLPTEFPAPATLDSRPHNLPVQATEFLGRANELGAIGVMLDSPTTRLLTIAGPGGAGKTRLALQVAAEHLEAFRDGVYFVDLSAERDPDSAFEAVVRALGLPSSDDTPPLEVLTTGLRDREMLLILDNFEQLTAAAVGVADLVQKAPLVKVLVTSRETLRVRAEHVYPVPPMALPHPESGLAAIADSEAVQLFVERARTVRPDFELTEDNAATVASICLRLDGLPLAIELAAARLNVFTPADLLARITERLDVLGAGGRDLPDRQRTLWGAIGWSYELLDPSECRVFEMMSVFSTASLDALESVAASLDVDSDVLETISSLVDKSLIRTEEHGATRRFGMLLMIKEYAATRLGEDPGWDHRVRHAHATYYSGLARTLQAGLHSAGRDSALAEIGIEIGNLRSAWRFWVGQGDVERLFTLIDGLWALHEAKGWYQAAMELASDTLAVLGNSPATPERAAEELAIRTSLARALMAVRGYGPEVEQAFQEVLTMVEDSGGTAAQRFPVLRALSTFHMNMADFGKCAAIGQEILDLGEAEGDPTMIVEGHYVFGMGTAFAGDVVTGLDHLDRVADLFDPKSHVSRRFQLGPSAGVVARTASGLLRWQLGLLERGVREVTRSLEVAREIDHPYSLAYALYHNGFLALLRGRFNETAEFARDLASVAGEHGYQVWSTLAHVLEGASLAAGGDSAEGVALTERGIELYQGLSTPPIFWPLIVQLRAQVHAMAGDPVRALELLDGILGDGAPDGEVAALTSKGDFAQMLDPPDVATAEAAYLSAIEISRSVGLRTFELMALTRMVRLRRSQSRADDLMDDLQALYETFTEGLDEAEPRLARETLSGRVTR